MSKPTTTTTKVRQATLAPPATGQALVGVEATGISFAEQGMRRGRYPGQPAFPFVPGYDLVGTVLAVGPDTSAELVGTRVAAVTKTGAWATHAVVPVADLVPVPPALDPAVAETVLVNGITAWQKLHRKARVTGVVAAHGAG